MLLNFKQCDKNVNKWFMHFNVWLLSLLTFKMVLTTWMLAQMKVSFSLLYAEWRIRMSKNVIEKLIQMQNLLLNLSYAQMLVFWY